LGYRGAVEVILNPQGNAALDAFQTMYPSRLVVHDSSADLERPTSTTFGFVVAGRAALRTDGLEATVDAGAFFSIPGSFSIDVTDGKVVCIERVGFRGLLSLGRIEEKGRLAYIDGCSDTVLCMPARLGDPVFNHLHFPPGIVQSLHSHPSVRIGVVARGDGTAYGPSDKSGKASWERPLVKGAVFLLHAHEIHAFRTSGGGSMDIIAYHPDSDWGPTDNVHPMINRTYLAR
jgi:quercetin dioxygenase-like cupin family protein